jgi:O-antigen/teichoic acid export membrane protein
VFTWLTTVGLVFLLPRQLGDVDLGKLATAISLTDLCGLIGGLGITNYLTKEVARRGTAARADVLNGLVTRIPLSLAAGAVAVTAATVLGYDTVTRQAVFLFCLNIALASFSGVLLGALQGLQHMRPVALITALSKALYLGLVAIAVLGGHGVLGVAIAANIASVVTLVGYAIPVLRRRAIGGTIAPGRWMALLRGSAPFFVWQAALMVYGQIDVVLLAQLTHDAVVGWYVAAYRIVGIPVFIPVIIATATFPALSRSATVDGAHFRAVANRSIQAILLLTLPMSIGTMVLADRLLDFLNYPAAFRSSLPLIIILAAHIPLVGVDMIIGNVLNARDRQRRWAITGVAAAILNPLANLGLISYFNATAGNGAVGAAAATVVTELFMMTMGLILLRGEVLDLSTVRHGLRCLTAGFVMAVVVWLVRDTLALPLVVAVGAIVYGGLSFALGTISPSDVRLLRTYVGRRSARVGAAA